MKLNSRKQLTVIALVTSMLIVGLSGTILAGDAETNLALDAALPTDVVARSVNGKMVMNAAVKDLLTITDKDLERGIRLGYVYLPNFSSSAGSGSAGGYFVTAKASQRRGTSDIYLEDSKGAILTLKATITYGSASSTQLSTTTATESATSSTLATSALGPDIIVMGDSSTASTTSTLDAQAVMTTESVATSTATTTSCTPVVVVYRTPFFTITYTICI